MTVDEIIAKARENMLGTTGRVKKPFVDNVSSEIFQLRKEKKLDEAHELALKSYNEKPKDEWIQKAYAWVLIDIIKAALANDTNRAHYFFKELNSIDFVTNDDILSKQINLLKPKLNPENTFLLQAETLSKNGNHVQSLDIFRKAKYEGILNKDSFDAYGWAIYRYIKASESTLEVEGIKKLLFEYLKLENERPSLLHSVVLQFVVHYVATHKDFDIFKFFQIWGSKNLRHEDIHDQYESKTDEFLMSAGLLIKSEAKGKIYPSLLKKLLKTTVNSHYPFDINYLIDAVEDKAIIVEPIRETYFWKIFSAHKENKVSELWHLFDSYATNFSNYKGSHWHSEILNLAERFMVEGDAWRFFEFFRKWDYKNFQLEDWKEQKNGESTYKSLAAKSLKIIFELIKDKKEKTTDIRWVIELYKLAFERLEKTVWLSREYAFVLYEAGLNKEAIDIYKKIILELGDQAYVWHEFSKIVANNEPNIAIAMLCKAMSIQKNEDFLGEMHIDLSKLLISQNLKKEAYVELKLYEKHRQEKNWKLSPEFNSLISQCSAELEENLSNKNFYANNLDVVDEYIYVDFPWVDAIVDGEFKTEDGKERLILRDFHNIEFTVNKTKYKLLKHAKKDDVFKFKLFYDETKQRYVPLIIDKSSLDKNAFINNAPKGIAVVDHVNNDKKLFHYVLDKELGGVIFFSNTELRPNVGDLVELQYYKTFNKKEKKYKINILSVVSTNKTNPSLRGKITGSLSLKYKYNSYTYDFYDLPYDAGHLKASFGFLGDYYVPKYLLEKYKIEEDCQLVAQALFNGEKWQIFDIAKEENV
ncbi:MAG: hypothetical protein JZU62_06895 [Sulfuricurvum sp.]|uniref:DUF7017 domain-containing protein n=1 Tax=Sulfuricurvum sp. TaxID=2025608 RepID=UPI0025CBEBD7|nr:hypothetical protein [Sulfuricurvum sp.]MBV5321395.1 hypothetical protein [Sulfuricurvum sp.]